MKSKTLFFVFIAVSFASCITDIVLIGFMHQTTPSINFVPAYIFPPANTNSSAPFPPSTGSGNSFYYPQLIVIIISIIIYIFGIIGTILNFPADYPAIQSSYSNIEYAKEVEASGNVIVQQINKTNKKIIFEFSFQSVFQETDHDPHFERNLHRNTSILLNNSDYRDMINTSTIVDRITLAFDLETFLELVAYGFGLGFLKHSPGIAALRVLRIFRYFGYLKVILVQYEMQYSPTYMCN